MPPCSACKTRFVSVSRRSRRGRPPRAWAWTLGPVWTLLALALGLLGCGPDAKPAPAEPFRGPILLITLADLRADAVTALDASSTASNRFDWTPELNRFAEEADWVGRGVSASSSPVTAILSLATGVDPWQHGVLSHVYHHRDRRLPTLGQMMSDAGFATRLYSPGRAYLASFGPYEGFQEVMAQGSTGASPEAFLADLGPGPTFTWIHLNDVDFPYRDRRSELPRLADRPIVRSPIERRELMYYADPERAIPEDALAASDELYHQGVAMADRRVGALLDALRGSGRFDDALVILTALHGTELGERGQTLFAQNLGRETLEVPLLMKWPTGLGHKPAERSPVAIARLWSTLAQVVGVDPAPVHLPGLLSPYDLPILSSLYFQDGHNRFSALVPDGAGGNLQITAKVPFIEPEPRFFDVQTHEAGIRMFSSRHIPRRIRRRMISAFEALPPMRGMAPPEITVERWLPGSGTQAVTDPELTDRLTPVLERRWNRFVDRAYGPKEEMARRVPLSSAAAGS